MIDPNSDEWAVMNRRRAELIRKKNREGLSAPEHQELTRLQEESARILNRAYPRPAADREAIERLSARLGLGEPPHE